MMVKLTESLKQWLLKNHSDKISLIMLGHIELLTSEMWDECVEWCKTDDGRQHLEGGIKYKAVE